MTQIGAQEICPCGSGLKHIDCCLDRRGFKWITNDKGEVCKSIKLDKESAAALKRQFERVEKSGDPNPEGLIFPNIDPDKYFNFVLATMVHPDIHEAAMGYRAEYDVLQIYGYLVEDLVLSKENIVKLDTTDRALVLNAMTIFFYEPDKEKLLKPYKKKMDKTLYKIVLRIFKTEPVSKEDLIRYIDIIGDESVLRMAEKQKKLNRNSICLCGSGKKYKKCCGKK